MPSRTIRTLTATAVAAGLTVAGLTVPSAASAAAPTLTASSNTSVVVAGQRPIIRGHLTTTSFYGHNLPVQVAQKGSATVHGSTRVDSHGNFIFEPLLLTNTAVAIFYPGSSQAPATDVVLHISTRVYQKTAFKGDYKTSGGYHYVKAGKTPSYAVGIAPNKSGGSEYFTLQVYRSGAWRTVQTSPFSIDKDSVAGITITGTKGYKYRVHAQYRGDSRNAANTTPNTYLRFV